MRNYKKLAIVIGIMILAVSIASSAFAAGTFKDIKAFFNNIKIYRNGILVQMPAEPFIIDGTTYVPLRAVSEMFEKDVTWDPTTYSIGINDKPGTSLNELYNQIYSYQIQNSQLEKKVKDLEAQLASKPSAITSISAMEKYLNNQYGTYKKIDFEFDLSESKSKITVGIYVDLDVDYSRWNNLSSSDLEGYLQDVVDDIDEAFPNKTIAGFIEDIDKDKELVSFTVNSKGKVVTSKSSGSSSDVEDMEYDLDRYYSGSNGIKSVELKLSKSKLYLTVYVDKGAWDRLSYDRQDDILEYMYDDIRYYFDETIYGEIRNNSSGALIFEFDYSSNGTVYVY